MKLQGYCHIKTNADLSRCMGEKKDWINLPIRVLEFNDDSESCLVIDRTATQVGMIEYKDIVSKFKCIERCGVLLPWSDKSEFDVEITMEVIKRKNRKGGYCELVKAMVVQSSLHSGEFNDKFLFQKQ
jgi:hypothetical protein